MGQSAKALKCREGEGDTPELAKNESLAPADVNAALAEKWLQQGKDSYFGNGVPQSYAEAFAWFSKAAAAGHPEAQFHVALCFEDGDGVRPDQAQAAEWYRKSAMGGFAKAQNNLAICYRDGQGVRPNYAEAQKWYSMAAEQGYAPASCEPKSEVPSGLGRMGAFYRYKFGHGAPKDGAEAVKWYRMEAERGSADAQTNLGVCYEFGHGVPRDHAEAARWYRMAAEQECGDAQNKLLVGIRSGCIVPLDGDEWWKWYLKETAAGVVRSFRKEAKWGEAWAQLALGLGYEKGYGVPQDIIEAYKWFKLAVAQDCEKAAENLTSLASTMTEDQVTEGERRYREFKSSGNTLAAQPRKIDRPRIVLVDDDAVLLEMLLYAIRDWFKNPTLLSFQDGETAWQELLRTDPDLLITDIVHPGMNGLETVRLLAERRVRYPILVTSGSPLEKDVFRCAGPDLNVTFLRKPYRADEVHRQLLIHIGPSDNHQLQGAKAAP